MKTEHRIYAALGVLALCGGGLYLTRQGNAKQAQMHAATATSADMPTLAVPKDDVEKITKIEIKNPGKEAGKETNVVLEKTGDSWEVKQPLTAKANAANVRSLLDNLKELKVKESIDKGTGTYKQYELDDKAVHVTAYKGADKAIDVYLGKSGSRGQMARIGGRDGAFIVDKYQSYLYTRELKNWRETSILKFEDANAVEVEVSNKNGLFSFSKNGDKWSGSYKKRGKDKDKKGDKDKDWKKFDEAKVKDLLRAFKSLNADDFAEKDAETGLDAAEENGGVVKIKLKDNAGEHTIKVGKTAKGTSRFAIKEPGDGTIFTVSSWSADWASAEAKKFEKGDDKDKKDKKDPEHEPEPMGMPFEEPPHD